MVTEEPTQWKLIDSFNEFDLILRNDIYLKELILKNMDSYFDEINNTMELGEYLEGILEDPLPDCIERIFVNPSETSHLLKEHDFLHTSFYLTLFRVYGAKYFRKMLSRISPIYLEKLSVIDTMNGRTFRMSRADNVHFDFYANATTSVYVMGELTRLILEGIGSEEVPESREYICTNLRDIINDLTKIINIFESDGEFDE